MPDRAESVVRGLVAHDPEGATGPMVAHPAPCAAHPLATGLAGVCTTAAPRGRSGAVCQAASSAPGSARRHRPTPGARAAAGAHQRPPAQRSDHMQPPAGAPTPLPHDPRKPRHLRKDHLGARLSVDHACCCCDAGSPCGDAGTETTGGLAGASPSEAVNNRPAVWRPSCCQGWLVHTFVVPDRPRAGATRRGPQRLESRTGRASQADRRTA